jgi:hypothetical protein
MVGSSYAAAPAIKARTVMDQVREVARKEVVE